MSFFSSSYRRCRLSCFRTCVNSWRFSSTSGRSFSMSFFVRYRSCFRTCVNSWRLSMSFFTCCWSCRSTFSTSCYSWGLSMSFFTSYRCSFCMCFRTSCYSWRLSMSFRTSSNSRSWGLCMSFFSRASRWNFSMSFFISYRSYRLFCSSVRRSFCMSFLSCTSCYCRSTFSTSSSW